MRSQKVSLLLCSLLIASGAMARIEVHGHRGARALLPENTLAGFRHAVELGVDVLELDLAVTKDDRIIVAHDLHVNGQICLGPRGERLPRRGLALRELTLAELQRFDCGRLRHPDFPNQRPVPGERMPSFDEFLEVFAEKARSSRYRSLRMNIETKIDPGRPELSVDPRRFVELIVSALRRERLSDRAILQSFDPRTLAEARRLAPELEISLLAGLPWKSPFRFLEEFEAEYYSPSVSWLGFMTSRSMIESAARAGARVIPYTANSRREWERLVRNGVHGIITDDPAGLIDFLKEKRLR